MEYRALKGLITPINNLSLINHYWLIFLSQIFINIINTQYYLSQLINKIKIWHRIYAGMQTQSGDYIVRQKPFFGGNRTIFLSSHKVWQNLRNLRILRHVFSPWEPTCWGWGGGGGQKICFFARNHRFILSTLIIIMTYISISWYYYK